MRLTSKGQVTIPQEIRERLGLLPQTEVEFEIDGDAVRIRPARRGTSRGDALIARMRGTAARGLTTDQIMALTRR
jgi:AbrB family looped-hinge helix DNA binding protein